MVQHRQLPRKQLVGGTSPHRSPAVRAQAPQVGRGEAPAAQEGAQGLRRAVQDAARVVHQDPAQGH